MVLYHRRLEFALITQNVNSNIVTVDIDPANLFPHKWAYDLKDNGEPIGDRGEILSPRDVLTWDKHCIGNSLTVFIINSSLTSANMYFIIVAQQIGLSYFYYINTVKVRQTYFLYISYYLYLLVYLLVKQKLKIVTKSLRDKLLFIVTGVFIG